MLRARLEELKNERANVVNQDIDSYVEAKLEELRPQIRAEAVKAQAYETKVYDIRIAAFEEALKIVEAESTELEETENTEEIES